MLLILKKTLSVEILGAAGHLANWILFIGILEQYLRE